MSAMLGSPGPINWKARAERAEQRAEILELIIRDACQILGIDPEASVDCSGASVFSMEISEGVRARAELAAIKDNQEWGLLGWSGYIQGPFSEPGIAREIQVKSTLVSRYKAGPWKPETKEGKDA